MKAQINVPESLEDITLKQYQKWLKISEGKELDSFLQQKMIEIFCNVPLKHVLTIRVNYINEICKTIDELFRLEPVFINRFKYRGVKYGFIPKLDDITFGEYVDLDTYLADWDLMHKAMSVLYRPIDFEKGDEYTIDNYESADAYDLQNITLDIVFGAILFFYNLGNELQNHILSYLATQEEVDLPQELRASVLNGVGINPFTHYAKEIL
tara:strand:+ start:41 stop:670 length:630 start_codon:yes stop_codon:yes gene_type:complete